MANHLAKKIYSANFQKALDKQIYSATSFYKWRTHVIKKTSNTLDKHPILNKLERQMARTVRAGGLSKIGKSSFCFS
jgi:hypothetical protein